MNLDLKTQAAHCEKHGEYQSRNFIGSIWSRCPKCVKEEEDAAAAEAEKARREAKRLAWEGKVQGAGIPERFRDRGLHNFIAETPAQKRALKFATEYADNFAEVMRTGRSAIFCGHPGTGKTHLACGIGMRLMHRESRMVMFSTVVRAVRRVKSTWDRGSKETETEAIAALAYPDLLILDEVGVQFGSDAERLILFDIINERYERKRPTLLLSNLPPDGVKEYLGERAFDRLREDGGACVVFEGESWRGK